VKIVADILSEDKREIWNVLCHNSVSWLKEREAQGATDAGEAHRTNDTGEACKATDIAEAYEANDTSEAHTTTNDAGEACRATDTAGTHAGNRRIGGVVEAFERRDDRDFRHSVANLRFEIGALARGCYRLTRGRWLSLFVINDGLRRAAFVGLSKTLCRAAAARLPTFLPLAIIHSGQFR
jgi:hypothetical protein